MFISIVAVDEPNDVIVCEGRAAAFICELNTANTNISSNDVQWYRFIKNAGPTEMIKPNGTNINFTTNHSGNNLTTTLTITNAAKSHTGYYWVGPPLDDACNVSVIVRTSTYVNRVLAYTMYVTHM